MSHTLVFISGKSQDTSHTLVFISGESQDTSHTLVFISGESQDTSQEQNLFKVLPQLFLVDGAMNPGMRVTVTQTQTQDH